MTQGAPTGALCGKKADALKSICWEYAVPRGPQFRYKISSIDEFSYREKLWVDACTCTVYSAVQVGVVPEIACGGGGSGNWLIKPK
jgi:hypothetical protein